MTQNLIKIIAAVRSEGDAGRVVGQSLKSLRELVGLTQDQIADRLGVSQTAISKIESRGDVQISALEKYVRALGATLRIDAAFPTKILTELVSLNTFSAASLDENQLILPIFSDDISSGRRDVVLSIRPQYSQKILDGQKTVELRRRFPVSSPKGTLAYIYSTSPVRAMVGSAEITDVVKLPVSSIWKHYSDQALIEKPDFDAYFAGLEEGFALEFANVRPLPRALDLVELRERFGFEPPQSFLYAKPELRRAIKDEYSKVSH